MRMRERQPTTSGLMSCRSSELDGQDGGDDGRNEEDEDVGQWGHDMVRRMGGRRADMNETVLPWMVGMRVS